jgi:hypothetical protein
MVCKVFHIPWDICERSRTSLHELKAEASSTEGTEKKEEEILMPALFSASLSLCG